MPQLLELLAGLPSRRPTAAHPQRVHRFGATLVSGRSRWPEPFSSNSMQRFQTMRSWSATWRSQATGLRDILSLAPRRQLLYPMGWGTLGFGLPASIGAAVAAPGRRTICVAGDAGLLYAAGELATIAENQLPVTVIVNDDAGYGMLRFAGQARYGRDVGMTLRSPDFVALAASFGIAAQATEIGDPGLSVALQESVEGPGPSLLVIRGSLEPPRMSRLWDDRCAGTIHRPVGGPTGLPPLMTTWPRTIARTAAPRPETPSQGLERSLDSKSAGPDAPARRRVDDGDIGVCARPGEASCETASRSDLRGDGSLPTRADHSQSRDIRGGSRLPRMTSSGGPGPSTDSWRATDRPGSSIPWHPPRFQRTPRERRNPGVAGSSRRRDRSCLARKAKHAVTTVIVDDNGDKLVLNE